MARGGGMKLSSQDVHAPCQSYTAPPTPGGGGAARYGRSSFARSPASTAGHSASVTLK